jgi:hypothetical protein
MIREACRPPELAASFISGARTLTLAFNHPGWLNAAVSECPSISAAARLAAWRCSPRLENASSRVSRLAGESRVVFRAVMRNQAVSPQRNELEALGP